MHPSQWRLINAEHLEALPAELVRGRGNAVARRLAQADWLFRRKSDGRFVAVRTGDRISGFGRDALPRRLDADLAELAEANARPVGQRALGALQWRLHELGLADDYGESRGLALVAEPTVLEYAGRDRYRRPLWLTAQASHGWRALQAAARAVGLVLEAISGYRSHDYQLGIFRRKLARGLGVDEILTVNAAPGYSEHHGGNALDISTPGEPAAEESFEATPAFAWLQKHAGVFGFRMSYPRGNPHGIVYEPWHWCWVGD
jgi:D-alanyl-D-alanine carboxypeptidase